MIKTDFEDYICRHFCAYYRAGNKEEQACRGALVIDELVRRGRLATRDFPRGGFMLPPTSHDPLLDAAVCGICPFRAADCDFQAAPQVPGSPPCGGYRLLAMLIERHALSAGDLPAAPHG
ncbi:hypothetical protein [Trichloromonas sp.]|uniref:hypothetical protein n=1 Tax=Trichloromonas sp. TaxID=3069249 RepID=UPI003D81B66C